MEDGEVGRMTVHYNDEQPCEIAVLKGLPPIIALSHDMTRFMSKHMTTIHRMTVHFDSQVQTAMSKPVAQGEDPED